jgi:hypothetical protein
MIKINKNNQNSKYLGMKEVTTKWITQAVKSSREYDVRTPLSKQWLPRRKHDYSLACFNGRFVGEKKLPLVIVAWYLLDGRVSYLTVLRPSGT